MAEARRVFVAGATSAIAQAIGRLLAARGASFFLVARDPVKLAAVEADLRGRGASNVTCAVADLDELGRHSALVEDAFATLGGVDLALVAHGTLPDQARCEASFEAARAALHTNFLSAASLAAALANRLERQGAGTLAVMGSVAGDRGRRSNYVYGAAKGGLDVFCQGLRHRLHAARVNVLVVKPGFVDTPMTRDFPKGPLWASPERVARGIVRAVDRGAHVAYVPGFWRLVMAVVRRLPERIFLRTRL